MWNPCPACSNNQWCLHAFDQLLGNGQSDAGAFDAALLCVQAAKGLEQFRRLFLGDSDTRIGDGNAHEFSVQGARRHIHPPARSVEFDGIRKQIQKRLFKPDAIGQDRRRWV